MKQPPARHACPCCGQHTLSERATFAICPVCNWEDDGQDDTDAHLVRGGPNGTRNLLDARRNFATFGACDRAALGSVRPPRPDEMPFPSAILDLENQSIAGQPTLAQAYALLLREWRGGNRDREVGLHLLFLAWYLQCEPPHLTGHDGAALPPGDLTGVWREVHTAFAERIRHDAEMAYAIGMMVSLFPWLFGNEVRFRELGREYRALACSLAPRGPDPQWFANRGAYGHYFGEQAAAAAGRDRGDGDASR